MKGGVDALRGRGGLNARLITRMFYLATNHPVSRNDCHPSLIKEGSFFFVISISVGVLR